MAEIKEIKVYDLFSTSFLYVNFTLVNTSEDLGVYQFNLYKSNNQSDGFELLATDVKDCSFIDYNVNLYNIAINYYYKVEIVNIKTGDKTMSSVVGIYQWREPDNIADAIIFDYKTYLENVVPNQMYLLQRKHNGQLCTACYDTVRRRASNQNCPICYGTKYVGGYYTPQQINVNLMNSPGKTPVFTVSEDSENVSPIQLWTLNFPVINVNDIIVDKNNDRYIITSNQPSYKNYYLLRQSLQAQKVPEEDIVYTVPIPLNNSVNIDKIKKDNNITG